MKSCSECSDRSELSSLDAVCPGALGAAQPPAPSSSVLRGQTVAGPHLLCPSQKRQWDGHKGPAWVDRGIDCQSKLRSVSWQGWERQVQGILTRLFWHLFVRQS